MDRLKKGDYVFATKYSDGDPGDGWAIGFFDRMLPKIGADRFMVVDNDGHQYRGNGFRRTEVISEEIGELFIPIAKSFDWPNWGKPGEVNLWDHLEKLISNQSLEHT